MVQRLIGMPLSSNGPLGPLEKTLSERGLLGASDAAALSGRLSVTHGGFDLNPSRPNATLLLMGPAGEFAEPLARVLAQSLYGGEDRVTVIDFGRMIQDHDISMLIGSAPGYVGYSQPLPLHQLTQIPWSVLVCENVDQCHPTIRAVLAQALATGQIVNASGKRVYLSDAIVILTMTAGAAAPRAMGFHRDLNTTDQDAASTDALLADESRQTAVTLIGQELADECDLICSAAGHGGAHSREEGLLSGLRERSRQEKLYLNWEPSVLDWLKSQESQCHTARDWERLIDARVMPLLTPYFSRHPGDVLNLTLSAQGGALLIVSHPSSPPPAEDASGTQSR